MLPFDRIQPGRFQRSICSFTIVLLASTFFSSVSMADWNRFRGPNGSGVAEETTETPTTWSPTENLKWKVALPGAGVSCPIVVGDRLFVSCYSGYGVSRDEIGIPENLKRHLLCVDRKSGKTIWEKVVPSSVPEDPYAGMGVPEHGYASHTPTSDGKSVYVFFGKSGVLVYDFDGNELWKKEVGSKSDDREWGSSSSPIVYENVLIVPAGPESRAIIGLDKNTGKELWRADADSLGSVWGTPAIVKAGDTTYVVIGAPSEIWGLSPETGKLRWFCNYIDSEQFSSSIVVDGETVYAVEGRGGGSVAVKAGGKDDVSSTNIVWKGRDNSRFASPVIYQGRLYYVNNKVLNCVDAKTHEKIFEKRMQNIDSTQKEGERSGGGRGGRGGFGNTDYSSPVIADGKLYFIARSGETYVVSATAEFNQLAVNRLTTDSEEFSATPAISDGEIFIRSNKNLYCISAKK